MNIAETKLPDPPVVQGLSRENIPTLLEGGEKRNFAAGELLIRQDQPANEMFFLEEGTVQVEWRSPEGKTRAIYTAGPGDLVGWSWMFPPFISHFQVRALEAGKASVFKGGRLLGASERNPRFGFELMSRVASLVISRLQSIEHDILEKETITAFPETNGRPNLNPIGKDQPLHELLAQHSFLHGLSERHLRNLIGYATEVQFGKGQTLFRAGEVANRFYFILDGKIRLESSGSETSRPLDVLGAGDVLGWSWLYEPYQWHFNASALEPTRAIFIYATQLRELCQSDPSFGFELLKRVTRVVIHRLETLCKQIPN